MPSEASKKKAQLLSEEDIIKILWKHVGGKDPFDDDVSWIEISGRKSLLIAKSDMFASSTDAPPQMSPKQMAMKSITACASDFASKGVKPEFCLISIGFPKRFANVRFVNDLASGFRKASRLYHVKILGGDTGVAGDVTIDCSMFGFANRLVKRSGARIGDYVGVSGHFGLERSGLLLLLGKANTKDKLFRKQAIDSVLNPRARVATGLKIARYVRSSIDSSDGLALSLYHIAESSKKSIELDFVPVARGVEAFAKENSLSPNDLALYGGEEYQIVCTFPKESRSLLEKEGGIVIIGRVHQSGAKRETVSLIGKKIKRYGWVHFKSD